MGVLLLFPSVARAADDSAIAALWPIWGAAGLQVVVALASSALNAQRQRAVELQDASIRAMQAEVHGLREQLQSTRERHGDFVTREYLDRATASLVHRREVEALTGRLDKVEARLDDLVAAVANVREQGRQILGLLEGR